MQPTLEHRCRRLLSELKLVGEQDELSAVSLTGGVASDIALIRFNGRKLCAKFALPKLKVQADWFAPVHRNAAEYAWLEVAADVAPESAVRLFGRSTKLHGFAMEFLEGEDTYLWKTALLEEACDQGEAAKVGDLLGRIQFASTQPIFDAEMFQNRDDFHALRIEPYIRYSAFKHDDIASVLEEIADQLYESRQVLVHGDVSPKNIMLRAGNPIFLDAECATMGDASFDPSFCINHLVLKAVHLPKSRGRYLTNAVELWNAYAQHVSWEPDSAVETRVCRLLPALMLGRVDGKSPVEYLADTERNVVRNIAKRFIASPEERLDDVLQGIRACLREERA